MSAINLADTLQMVGSLRVSFTFSWSKSWVKPGKTSSIVANTLDELIFYNSLNNFYLTDQNTNIKELTFPGLRHKCIISPILQSSELLEEVSSFDRQARK
jgi:hypothetical protein